MAYISYFPIMGRSKKLSRSLRLQITQAVGTTAERSFVFNGFVLA